MRVSRASIGFIQVLIRDRGLMHRRGYKVVLLNLGSGCLKTARAKHGHVKF